MKARQYVKVINIQGVSMGSFYDLQKNFKLPFCAWSSLVRVPPPRTVAPLSGEELFTGFMSCLAISTNNITLDLCLNVV